MTVQCCPECGARTDETPEKWTGIYSRGADMTVAWLCPNGHETTRGQLLPVESETP